MDTKSGKWIWTDGDFQEMNWHDCYIHACAFNPEEFEFTLDLDYILKWIQPEPNETLFHFEVSPATLVFENVYDIIFDLSINSSLQIDNLSRTEPKPPRNKDFIHKDFEWRWIIDCNGGSVSFSSTGFYLYIRSAPQFGNTQKLDIHTRNGYSFLRSSFE